MKHDPAAVCHLRVIPLVRRWMFSNWPTLVFQLESQRKKNYTSLVSSRSKGSCVSLTKEEVQMMSMFTG